MKKLFSFLFIFFSITAFSQTQISDLYDLDPGINYPEYMPKVKKWIDETFTDVSIADLQYSPSKNHENNYHSFKFVSRKPLSIILPRTDGFKMYFAPEIESRRGIKTQAYRMNHQIDIKAYRLNPGIKLTYSLKEYYNYAKDILRLSDAQLIANSLNFMVESDGKNKIKVFIDDINNKTKLKISYPKNESVNELVDILRNTKKQCSDIIFETYINDKSEKIIEKKLNDFFSIAIKDGVVQTIDELRTHKVNVGMDKEEMIEIPVEFIVPFTNNVKDSLVKFQYKNFYTRLDFKNKRLEIHFLGQLNQPARFMKNIKQRSFDLKKKKEKWISLKKQDKGVNFSKLVLIINEKTIRIEAYNESEVYQILENKL